MKSVIRSLGFSALTVAVLAGCAATSTETSIPTSLPQVFQVPLAQPPQVSEALTLNQIMANPD